MGNFSWLLLLLIIVIVIFFGIPIIVLVRMNVVHEWDYMGLYGIICGLYGIIWDYMGLYGYILW